MEINVPAGFQMFRSSRFAALYDWAPGGGRKNFRQTIDDALTAGDTRLVINFAEVPMIDSSGIGILVKAMASAKQRGGGVKLVTPRSSWCRR